MKIDAFLTVKDLTELGFGSRVTIWKKVKNNKFPAPIKFGDSSKSSNHWFKKDIEDYIEQQKQRNKDGLNKNNSK